MDDILKDRMKRALNITVVIPDGALDKAQMNEEEMEKEIGDEDEDSSPIASNKDRAPALKDEREEEVKDATLMAEKEDNEMPIDEEDSQYMERKKRLGQKPSGLMERAMAMEMDKKK